MKKLLLAGLLAFMMVNAMAQDKDAASVERMVASKNYIFKARSSNSQRGRVQQLTPEYDLTIRPDSVIAWLPFFGRAYSAPINTTDGGIKFTSTDFDYTTKKGKRNSWQITIKPKDEKEVQQLYLNVSVSGMASLQVVNTNRDGMSYTGYLVEGPAGTKKAF